MSIIHTSRKDTLDELIKKNEANMKFENSIEKLTTKQKVCISEKVKTQMNNLDANRVCLGFRAFRQIGRNQYESICDPVFSAPIKNKSTLIIINLIHI